MIYRKIYKYGISIVGAEIDFELPLHSTIVKTAQQPDGDYYMWVEVYFNDEVPFPTETRTFKIFGTGHKIEEDFVYVDTFITRNEVYVWHLYEKKEFTKN